jgi:hypothetical protein
MREVNMKVTPKVAGIRVVAITEYDFILKMLFVMGTFFFYIRDLSIKFVIFRLVSGV